MLFQYTYFVFLIIFIMCFKLYSCTPLLESYFYRIRGYRILGSYNTLRNIPSATGCCVSCSSEEQCLSVNYNNITGDCETTNSSPYTAGVQIENNTLWDIHVKYTDDSWTLLFRLDTGTHLSPYNLWTGTEQVSSEPGDGCRLLSSSTVCKSAYRSNFIDTWTQLGIKKVAFEFYTNGSRVAYIHFNGSGSGKMNWFRSSRILDTSYTAVSSNNTFRSFTVEGWDSRKFYINTNLGGCSNDLDLLMVHDPRFPRLQCQHDTQPSMPAFLYCSGNDLCVFDRGEYKLADTMAIFIQR